MSNKYLPYIKDEKLIEFVGIIVDKLGQAVEQSEKKLNSNVIDPFSAVFDACIQEISLSEWIEKEKTRQIQKTMQNQIGTFHENILGAVSGWEKLDVGNIIDIVSYDRKILAEIKNKHNTTKGNHKKEIYDDIVKMISTSKYKDFIGYYVEIIPKNRNEYDKLFTPPDNLTKSNRKANEQIRVIDGKSFYKLVTGREDGLKLLYKILPEVLSKCLSINENKSFIEDPLFLGLFQRAYN